MDDLISRQAAIELIENESRKWGDEYGVSDVLCDLSDMPSAQQIVRCKECKYWDFPGYCVDFMTQDENGFCKWGKRKETEND